jgi:hypothetical protein
VSLSDGLTEPRPCERRCRSCGYWKHYSRFQRKAGQGSVSRFSSDCNDCRTKKRNERKNEDRALWIIRERAKDHAVKYGVTFDFMWINMNWRSLVAPFRAACSDEGLCNSCGHRFDNERDIQIEHRSPPRHRRDTARLHARNVGFYCGSCNRGKSDVSYDEWLDKQEEARLSNEAGRKSEQLVQWSLFPEMDEPAARPFSRET